MPKVRVRVAGENTYFLDVPDEIISHNILRSVNLTPKQDILIQRIAPHETSKKCKCFACNLANNERVIGWIYPYVRFDIGAKNVRLTINDGDRFVAVKQADIEGWTQIFRQLGFPVGQQDLFRFAAVQSVPSKKDVFFFDCDHEFFNQEAFLE